MENAKGYLIVILLCFHILPLVFLAFGQLGTELLTQACMVYFNPMFLFAALLIYGIKIGFNFKMPLLASIFSGASVMMYYNFQNMSFKVMATLIMFIVYAIFAFGSIVLGSFIKRYFE